MFWWGYVSRARATWASKRMPSCMPKLDMFWWVVGFKVQVLRLMFRGAWFLIDRNEHWAAIATWHISMLICSTACSLCMETCIGPPQSK